LTDGQTDGRTDILLMAKTALHRCSAVKTTRLNLDTLSRTRNACLGRYSIHTFVHMWPWPLTSELENLFSNSHHSHSDYTLADENLSTMYRHIPSREMFKDQRTSRRTTIKHNASAHSAAYCWRRMHTVQKHASSRMYSEWWRVSARLTYCVIVRTYNSHLQSAHVIVMYKSSVDMLTY